MTGYNEGGAYTNEFVAGSMVRRVSSHPTVYTFPEVEVSIPLT